MSATIMMASGNTVNLSGTQFINQGAVQLCLMVAMSGLVMIPVACNNLGQIGSF